MLVLFSGTAPSEQLLAMDVHIRGCAQCAAVIAELSRQEGGAERGAEDEEIVAGRYRLGRLIGSGSMGMVFEAEDLRLGRKVALKQLRELPAPDEESVLRLQREAQTLARVNHPNVVQVYDVGHADSQLYLAMERIDGTTLSIWLGLAKTTGWRERLERILPAGDGLAAAHANGIIHRDIKPANILIDAAGTARVVDFGLARYRASAESELLAPRHLPPPLESNSTGDLVGTLAYMAPEQLEHGRADERSDQYAFCVTLVEALTGARPEAGRLTPAQRHLLPARLLKPLARGLAAAPEQRYPSMEELLRALRQTLAPRRRAAWLAALALGIGGLAAALVATRDPCGAPASAADRVWSPEAQARVSGALLRASPQEGAEVFARLNPVLSHQLARWKDTARHVCEAGRQLKGPHPELEARIACLSERKAVLGSYVGAVEAATRADLPRVVSAADALADPAICMTAEALHPSARGLGTKEIERALAESETSLLLGHYEQARERLESASRAAEEHSSMELLARARLLQAKAQAFLGKVVEAERLAAESVSLADRTGDDHLRARALVYQASLQGASLGQLAAASRSAVHARALLERLDNPKDLTADLEGLLGIMEMAAGHPADAARHFRTEIEQEESAGMVRTGALSRALELLGNANIGLHDYVTAERLLQRSRQLRESVLGPRHPTLANSWGNLSIVASESGQLELALSR